VAIITHIVAIPPRYCKPVIFDKIERWRKRRLSELRGQRRGKVSVTETGFYIEKLNENYFVAWDQVASIAAKKTDAFIGDTISLIVRGADGTSAEVAEHDAEWQDLLSAISEHLPGSLPYQNWTLHLLADNRQIIEVYIRR